MAEAGRGPFQVIHSEAILECLERWGRRARSAGVLNEFKVALRTIRWRLENEPLDWGEALCDLAVPHAVLRLGLHWVFAVRYAVYEDRGIVWVTRYTLLQKNPLGPDLDSCP